MKKLLIILTLSLSMLFSSYAYNAIGHRIIADIAYENLTPKARKELDKILGTKGIVYYSTWADEVRSDNAYSYSYKWHYQNLADNMSADDIKQLWNNPKSEGEHLFFAIDSLTKELKAKPENQEALKFLIHFIGDCVQPMHLGRREDLGGNRVKMEWFSTNTNLHALWDAGLIESQQYAYKEYSQFLQNRFEHDTEIAKKDLLASVQECYIVREKIYAYQLNENSNSYHYIYHFKDDLNRCLYMAGIQLSKVLNDIYN